MSEQPRYANKCKNCKFLGHDGARDVYYCHRHGRRWRMGEIIFSRFRAGAYNYNGHTSINHIHVFFSAAMPSLIQRAYKLGYISKMVADIATDNGVDTDE